MATLPKCTCCMQDTRDTPAGLALAMLRFRVDCKSHTWAVVFTGCEPSEFDPYLLLQPPAPQLLSSAQHRHEPPTATHPTLRPYSPARSQQSHRTHIQRGLKQLPAVRPTAALPAGYGRPPPPIRQMCNSSPFATQSLLKGTHCTGERLKMLISLMPDLISNVPTPAKWGTVVSKKRTADVDMMTRACVCALPALAPPHHTRPRPRASGSPCGACACTGRAAASA